MGKRQVGELEPTELVPAMLLSDLAAVPMQDFGLPLLYGVVPIITLLCITMLLSMTAMRPPPAPGAAVRQAQHRGQGRKTRQREMKRCA